MTLAVHSHFNNQHVWTGLSTDTKPSIGPNNPAGQSPTQNDLFYETDSGLTFVFANLAWKPFGDSSHVLIWQPSSLSWIRASADASGNLNVTLVSAATTSSNITQFGGTNISTGTGVGGAGIPRVTVSSDSFPATQAVSGTVSVKTAATGNAPTFVSVGITSTAVLGANANRKGCVLVNTSSATISLAFDGAAAVLNGGPTLVPFGSFSMDSNDFSTGAINAIASVAASNLAVQEWQ